MAASADVMTPLESRGVATRRRLPNFASLVRPAIFVVDACTGNSTDVGLIVDRTLASVSATDLASDPPICREARRAKSARVKPDENNSVPSGLWHEMQAVLSGRSCVKAD